MKDQRKKMNNTGLDPSNSKKKTISLYHINPKDLIKKINILTKTNGFVDYWSSSQFARRIDTFIDELDEIIKYANPSQARDLIDLLEYAIEAVSQAMNSVDDSDGLLGDVLDRLENLHIQACMNAKPDPVKLAQRLFDLELNSKWDTFFEAVGKYRSILGEEGIARYKELIEERWKHIPQLNPGDRKDCSDSSRFRITHMMLGLAKVSGNVEEIASVLSRDLSFPYSFLEIAQAYRNTGKFDDAMEWAKRGIKEFLGQRPDERLLDFIAEEYDRKDQSKEAIETIWKGFQYHPSEEGYFKLKQYANRINKWDDWKKKTIEFIRTSSMDKTNNPHQYPLDQSLLVRIFIQDGDLEAAWQEALSGGCSDEVWMELANLREKDHPQEVVPIYIKQVERLIQTKPRGTYNDAIRLLQKVRNIMKDLGKNKELADIIQRIRSDHKLKRSLMKLLDEKIRI